MRKRVSMSCQIIVACDVTDASNDKQQAAPIRPGDADKPGPGRS